MAGAAVVKKQASGAGGAGGGDMFEDPRIDALMKLVGELPDNNDVVGTRNSVVRAQTHRLNDHETALELPTRKSDARLAFAEFVSEYLGRTESLDQAKFEFLLQNFESSEAVRRERNYAQLDSSAQARYIDAIRDAKAEFLLAYSSLTEESAVLPSSTRATLASFTAMPENIDQVNDCFDRFLKDERFAGELDGASRLEQFRSFKIARIASGIVETPKTAAAIREYAEFFELAA